MQKGKLQNNIIIKSYFVKYIESKHQIVNKG